MVTYRCYIWQNEYLGHKLFWAEIFLNVSIASEYIQFCWNPHMAWIPNSGHKLILNTLLNIDYAFNQQYKKNVWCRLFPGHLSCELAFGHYYYIVLNMRQSWGNCNLSATKLNPWLFWWRDCLVHILTEKWFGAMQRVCCLLCFC